MYTNESNNVWTPLQQSFIDMQIFRSVLTVHQSWFFTESYISAPWRVSLRLSLRQHDWIQRHGAEKIILCLHKLHTHRSLQLQHFYTNSFIIIHCHWTVTSNLAITPQCYEFADNTFNVSCVCAFLIAQCVCVSRSCVTSFRLLAIPSSPDPTVVIGSTALRSSPPAFTQRHRQKCPHATALVWIKDLLCLS